jgi:hypothetical protein
MDIIRLHPNVNRVKMIFVACLNRIKELSREYLFLIAPKVVFLFRTQKVSSLRQTLCVNIDYLDGYFTEVFLDISKIFF